MDLKKTKAHKLWHELSEELKKYNLDQLYLCLLIQSSSVNNLEKRHSQLPENHQLPRVKLEKLVQIKRLIDKNQEDLSNWFQTSEGLLDLYLEILGQDHHEFNFHRDQWRGLVFSKGPYGEFSIKFTFMPEKEFRFTCYCNYSRRNNREFLITVYIRNDQLTEQLVHCLRQNLPNYMFDHDHFYCHLNFKFLVRTWMKLEPKKGPYTHVQNSDYSYEVMDFYGSNDFVERLKVELELNDIPVLEITQV